MTAQEMTVIATARKQLLKQLARKFPQMSKADLRVYTAGVVKRAVSNLKSESNG